MSKPTRPVSIGGIEFDALITSSETLSADVPDYPCESGYSVHDTIVTKPTELSLTLFLSNNPVTWYNRLGNNVNRVQMVEEKLRGLFASRQVLTVMTATDKFRNMCITSVGISKSKENGNGRGIDVTLKQVNITNTRTTSIPASYGKSGSTMSNAGNAGTSGASKKGNTAESKTSEKSTSKEKASMLYNVATNYGLI